MVEISYYNVPTFMRARERRKNMRKNSKSLLGLVVATALAFGSLFGCGPTPPSSSAPSTSVPPSVSTSSVAPSTSSVAEVTATGISVTTNPTKISYFVGDEEVDASGLVVTLTYSDNSTRVLEANEYTLSEPDMSVAGQKTITVTYGNLTTTFNITVVAVDLVGIQVSAQPDKVEYERNEDLDLTGLAIAGVYNNGDTEDVTGDCTFSDVDMSTSGDKEITVTYGTFTVTFVITVKVPTQVKVVIQSYPTKTYYYIGETQTNEGLKIAWLMSDGSYEDIPSTQYSVSSFDTSAAGQKEVTVTVGDAQVRYNVYVAGPVQYTYNSYTAVSPSNWNELTYQDTNDTQIMNYISGSFFSFDFAYDQDGEIIPGGYQVQYNAVSAVEDVTATYAGDPKYAVPATAEKGFAYKFTLRNDLKWDDGTAIKAEDFVYTMKEQENPDFFNYRADSFYNGATVIHNAKNYLFQGQDGYFGARTYAKAKYGEELYKAEDDADYYFRSYTLDCYEGEWSRGENNAVVNWFLGNNPDYYDYVKNYGVFIIPYLFSATAMSAAECIAASAALDQKSLAEIKADSALNDLWEEILGFWQTDPNEELDLLVAYILNPPVSFDDVGIFVGDNDYELVLVLDKVLNIFKEDGVSLSYKAAYNFSSLPLVKKDLYEANKVEPQLEGGLWTSKYNSSVASTASWGPYKLSYFQAGKQYILDRNPHWYGYNMDVYRGQYQTQRIVCDTISQWNTAWLAFQNGDLASIGIDVSIAADYKNSSRAVFTADDFVSSLQLQSDVESLIERSDPDHNKILLKYKDFRQAISLGIDRLAYTQRCTTSSLPGFGLFNSMHYYDVENGGVYRDTDFAKEVLCNVYGVDVEEFESLDDAHESITGYNLDLAKQLLEQAYAAALAAGEITATDKVVLTVGASVDSEAARRQFNFLKESIENLAVGTSLEGRLTLEFDASFGSKWANAFRDGEYDICTGGWSGAAWDPGYFLMAYLSPDYMYSKAWDTSSEMLTLNPYDDGEEEHTYEMSLMDWWYCLNGAEGVPYDWSFGEVDNEIRLRIIAALEEAILSAYYSLPMYNYFSAQLTSYKIELGTKDYNTFMGYGGIRYTTYNYTDAQWAEVKATFDYKN